MTTTINQNKAGGLIQTQTAPTSSSARNWRLNDTHFSLLISIHEIIVKGNKHYIVPSINRLRELLVEFHDVDIRRRWTFQCLQDLESAGYIKRKRRTRRLPDNRILSRPGIITLTMLGIRKLVQKKIVGARKTLQAMIAWFHRNDNRFPWPSDIAPLGETMERSAALARLQEMYEKIGRGPAGGITPAAT